jgi:hypothetical protein
VSYQTLTQFKRVLKSDSAATAEDATYQRLLDVATAKIDTYCGRSFVSVSEARSLDAPEGAYLPVNDLIGVPTSVTAYGGTLIPLTDYLLITDDSGAGRSLVRINSFGFEQPWTTVGGILTSVSPRRAVIVTGVWNAPPPAAVVQACEMIATRMWNSRRNQYSSVAGESSVGLVRDNGMWIDADVKELLAPYVTRSVPTILGSSTEAT